MRLELRLVLYHRTAPPLAFFGQTRVDKPSSAPPPLARSFVLIRSSDRAYHFRAFIRLLHESGVSTVIPPFLGDMAPGVPTAIPFCHRDFWAGL